MTEFTPGPWTISQWSDRNPIDIKGDDAKRTTVARVSLGPKATTNARLIAAAPALYAALEQLVTDYGDVPGATDTDGQTVMADARAALAAARGDET